MTVAMQSNNNDEFFELVGMMVKLVLASLLSGVVVAVLTPLGFLSSLIAIALTIALLIAHDELVKPKEPCPLFVVIIAAVHRYILGFNDTCYFNVMDRVRRDMIMDRNAKAPKKKSTARKKTTTRKSSQKKSATKTRKPKKDNRTSAKKKSDALAGFGLGMKPNLV